MEKRVLSRREFVGLGGMLATAGVLAGCAPKVITETQVVTKQETVVVEKVVKETAAAPIEMEWWPGWPGNYMLACAKKFEDANPDIKPKVVSSYPDKEMVLAAVAAGTVPAVVEDIPYMELIVRGVFLPINDYLATLPELGPKGGDIRDELWNTFAWKGQYFGVPSCDTAGREGLGLNTRMCEEAGLDWTKPPRSWDEAFEWHKRMTKFDASGNLITLGFDPMAERTGACSDGDPWMWPHMWGFKYIDENYQFHIDRPETVEFLGVIGKFAQDVGVEKLNGIKTAFENYDMGAFGQGIQGMAICYPGREQNVLSENPKDKYMFGWVPMPANRATVTIQTAGGHAGMIMKDTKYPDQAWKLAVFLTSDEVCDILLKEVGFLGARKSWQQKADISQFPEHVQKSMRWWLDSLYTADEVWWNVDPIEGITQDEWRRVYQAVQYGQMTPEQGAKEMQDKLTQEIQTMFGS